MFAVGKIYIPARLHFTITRICLYNGDGGASHEDVNDTN